MPEDRTTYLISDLHIGGDEQLEEVPFLAELIDFLQDLQDRDEDAELIINGDAFGLWEFTELTGPEKIDHLIETYPELFAQFKETGKEIQITLVPGNHDHELAAYDAYKATLKKYNIDLVQDKDITRVVGDQTIHIEHGHQRDPNNRIEDWGNPYDTPLGYHYNTHVVSRAGKLSEQGRFDWLKDIQAITPTERVPSWLVSKYFYREMNPLLRNALIPFLLLFNITVLLAIVAGLDLAGIITAPTEEITMFLSQFGPAGSVAWMLLVTNVAIVGLFVLAAIPLYFLKRDLQHTIDRFGLLETALTVDAATSYTQAAQEIFDETDASIFCYGHTHRPELTEIENGVLVNSGTWLKRMHRRDGPIGILPAVFYPSYQLYAVRIEPDGDAAEISFEQMQKPTPAKDELTWYERLLTVGRAPEPTKPDPVVVGPER